MVPAQIAVDVLHGHKTGAYLDQRENRAAFAQRVGSRTLLDVFCYGAGFTVAARRAGSPGGVAIDSSNRSLAQARATLGEAGLAEGVELLEDNAFFALETLVDEGRRFGAAVVDPPNFVKSRRHVPKALSGYGELVRKAIQCLEPGGLLAAACCSQMVSDTDWERMLEKAGKSTGRTLRIIERRGQAPDHPVPPGFEEGRYLKFWVVAVL